MSLNDVGGGLGGLELNINEALGDIRRGTDFNHLREERFRFKPIVSIKGK